MKILLAPLLLAVSLPAFAEVDPKIHKLCIEAKDYAGCVKAQGAMGDSDRASSGVAEARSKEMSDKLYDFNKRQFIVQNPSLAGWIKSNPKLARESIEKEFLFFRKDDYRSSEEFYDICKRRGKTIDENFNWPVPCSGTEKSKTLKENNEWIHQMTVGELKRLEDYSILESKCKEEGKSIRRISGDISREACMSDFEYASYEEQQRSRRAEEAYRARMIRQGEIDRKNAARRRGLEALGDSLEFLGEQMKGPKTINCTTTYGSYTSNTSCY